jgi:radical SAM superfamily enzyme YgiQ (UPF0313 family)
MQYRASLVQSNDDVGGNVILPLAIGVLWQYAQQHPIIANSWQLGTIVYNKKNNLDYLAADLATSHIVFMSSYIWNLEYHIELASKIKQINHNCFIVMGGPEIHDKCDLWTLTSSVDLAIDGEGEESFLKILLQWPLLDLNAIPGAFTKSHYHEIAPRQHTFEYQTSPYLSGFYNNIVRHERSQGKTLQAVIQTNRGCPYHCTFCEEGKSYKNKIFFYDEQRIKDEVTWIGKNQIEFLTIADDNWGIVDQDVELMQHICQVSKTYGYPKIIDATYAKNAPDRLLKIAQIDHDMGTNLIRGVTVSLQSTYTPTLSAIKRFNLVDHRQQKMVDELHKINIPTYVEIIWPLPHETLESFCNGIDQVIDNGTANWLAVYPLGLLKSADLYQDHLKDYKFASSNDVPGFVDFYPSKKDSMPVASNWASYDEVIQGHVIYGWIAVLHYFGFASPVLDWLHQHKKISKTQCVMLFREFLNNNSNKSTLAQIDNVYQEFWQAWLQRKPVPEFGILPREKTQFWYPYTHLGCAIQYHLDDFYLVLSEFLLFQGANTAQTKLLIEQCQHSTVRFNQSYPYKTTHGQTVNLSHSQPEFSDLAEFSRYYYWWNRKKALSKINLDCGAGR